MTGRMRWAFVDQGGGSGIDTDKAKRWDIALPNGHLVYEADDPVASGPNLHACIGRGVGAAIFRDPDWLRATMSGADCARQLSQDLTDKGFGPASSPTACAAVFDNERQNAAEIIEMLTVWRSLRPLRLTVWTLMCFQGGWIRPATALVQRINNDPNLIVAPQAEVSDPRPSDTPGYDPMYPAMQSAVVDDLVKAGIRRDRIRCFIDGTRHEIPYGWEGIIFGFANIAASPPFPL